MVNRPEQGTNTATIFDSFEFHVKPFQKKPQILRDLYLEKGFSAAQIADRLGCSKSCVIDRLKQHGIRVSEDRRANPKNYRYPYTPYGYAVRDGQLVANRREIKVCRMVVQMRSRGGKTFSEIARELVKKGIKNRRGQVSWQHVTVANIYKRWRGKL